MNTNEISAMDELRVIELAQSGSKPAVEFLLDKYKNFVKSKARTYFLIGAEKSDIIQEGMIGLYKAIKDYNPEGGSSFRSFADLCITRHIITAVKTATRLKHLPLNSYISLNKPSDDESESTMVESIPEAHHPDPEEIMINKERLDLLERQLHMLLSKYEIAVLKGYIQGKTYQEMSRELEKPEKSIDNALQRIKKKLQKLSEDDEEGI